MINSAPHKALWLKYEKGTNNMRRNFKSFVEKNRWLKAVPNTLTVCNSLCGFLAIVNTLQVYNRHTQPEAVFVISSLMILGAMVFDALDGFAARIFNAASLKGIQMDSLADMVTFGVAPAVLVCVMAHKYSLTVYGYPMAWLFCAIYIACCAHRLARYNVSTMIEKKSGHGFTGLPSTGGAAAVCSLVFLVCSNKFDPHHQYVRILPFYVCILGLLFVSNIKYNHFTKWLPTVRRNKLRMILLIVIVIFIIIQPAIGVAIVVNAYVILHIIAGAYRSLKFAILKRK